MDDFMKSVRTSEEASQVQNILSKSGMKLIKWTTSVKEVKSQIPETWTKIVEMFKDEPQFWNSSVIQWKHVKDIENPPDVGTRVMSIEELKKSVCLNGPPCLQKNQKDLATAVKIEAQEATSNVASETKSD